jgi:HPt (histidine-containing phosphotransfer) domain-containing protein
LGDRIPKWISDIRSAIRDGDAQKLRDTAHGMTGATGQFGADAVAAAASNLERMGRDEALGGSDEALASLEVALREFETVMKSLREEFGPAHA